MLDEDSIICIEQMRDLIKEKPILVGTNKFCFAASNIATFNASITNKKRKEIDGLLV